MAVSERVATHVDEHERVGPETAQGGLEAGDHRAGPPGGVDEQRRLAGQLGRARLGEAHAARGDVGARARQRRARSEVLGQLVELVESAWTGMGVDDDALPSGAADDRARSVQARERLGDGERAHHITAATHPDEERAARGGEQCVDVGHARTGGSGGPGVPDPRGRRRGGAGPLYLTKPSARRYWRATSSGFCLSSTTRELSSIITRSVSGFCTRSTTCWASGPTRRTASSRTRNETL